MDPAAMAEVMAAVAEAAAAPARRWRHAQRWWRQRRRGIVGQRRPGDPNSLVGPAGFGSEAFIASAVELPYRVNFENEPTATAPAQRVDITDQLDPNLDWSTFQLTQVGFGDTIITIPTGSQYFATTVPMTYNGQTFDVEIELGLNAATGQVYAHFQSIDPTTQLPPDVLTGFLPPEDGTGRGMGFFSYIVQPKAGLTTGTQIRNVALVTFDLQPSIATDQVDDHDPSKGIDPEQAGPQHDRRRPADQHRRPRSRPS